MRHPVRVVMLEGAPWFVAADLLPALGWSRENLRYHQRSTLIAGERGVAKLPTIGRGEQAYAIISESGLYKPKAVNALKIGVSRDAS